MSGICRFTATASRDIERILDYIADQADMAAAERLLSSLNSQCQRLANFPGMGRRRSELGKDLRSFPVEKYLIFYRQIEDGVEIIRVLSGYQDLEAFFTEPEE
jgi:toxin ParE1/3/4